MFVYAITGVHLYELLLLGSHCLISLAGHYVVICGYDTDRDEFEIRDPASSRFCIILSLSIYYFTLYTMHML